MRSNRPPGAARPDVPVLKSNRRLEYDAECRRRSNIVNGGPFPELPAETPPLERCHVGGLLVATLPYPVRGMLCFELTDEGRGWLEGLQDESPEEIMLPLSVMLQLRVLIDFGIACKMSVNHPVHVLMDYANGLTPRQVAALLKVFGITKQMLETADVYQSSDERQLRRAGFHSDLPRDGESKTE